MIEIIIVVAIVIVLTTIAVPGILRSRVVANEGAAIANLRALNNACQAYHMNEQRYPDSLQTLANVNPPYIDNVLGAGTKEGYQFNYESSDQSHFIVHANPAHTGLLRGRYFYLDEGGTIRTKNDGEAGPDDPIVG